MKRHMLRTIVFDKTKSDWDFFLDNYQQISASHLSG